MGCEVSKGLVQNDSANDKDIFGGHSAVILDIEVAVRVKLVSHGELRVFVFILCSFV